MIRICTAVGVAEQSIWTECVIVGAMGRGTDRERKFHDRRFEYPLLAHEWYATSFPHETLSEQSPGQDIPMRLDLKCQPIESAVPDLSIVHIRYAVISFGVLLRSSIIRPSERCVERVRLARREEDE